MGHEERESWRISVSSLCTPLGFSVPSRVLLLHFEQAWVRDVEDQWDPKGTPQVALIFFFSDHLASYIRTWNSVWRASKKARFRLVQCYIHQGARKLLIHLKLRVNSVHHCLYLSIPLSPTNLKKGLDRKHHPFLLARYAACPAELGQLCVYLRYIQYMYNNKANNQCKTAEWCKILVQSVSAPSPAKVTECK